jgi:hypothetical protein
MTTGPASRPPESRSQRRRRTRMTSRPPRPAGPGLPACSRRSSGPGPGRCLLFGHRSIIRREGQPHACRMTDGRRGSRRSKSRGPALASPAAHPGIFTGVSSRTGVPFAAECNKAPFMYEMKGALSGHAAPDHPVTRARQFRIASRLAFRLQSGQSPSLPGSGSAGCPASPAPVRPVPSRSGCGPLVAQPPHSAGR